VEFVDADESDPEVREMLGMPPLIEDATLKEPKP
jgi:Mrp family chromosome partitioning ATPase